MRLRQLNEKFHRQEGYAENPTPNEILGMLNRADEDIRGLIISDGTMYFWTIEELDQIHQEFYEMLCRNGMAEPRMWAKAIRLYVEKNDDETFHEYGDWQPVGPIKIVVWANYTGGELPVNQIPQLAPLLRKLKYVRPAET